MLPIISRRFEIDAGHRLMNHAGKCKNYHGHRYVIEVFFKAPTLDPATGMVIDFGVVKDLIGTWLDEHWDHGMILQRGDEMIRFLYDQIPNHLDMSEEEQAKDLEKLKVLTNPKVFVIDEPPTVENLVRIVHRQARRLLQQMGLPVTVPKVVMWETPNCKAEFESDL